MGLRSEEQDAAVLSRGQENNVPVVEANAGVMLVASDGAIVAVDRHEEGVTFGEINIPPAVASDPDERDRVEQDFLMWRKTEMKARLKDTLDKLQNK